MNVGDDLCYTMAVHFSTTITLQNYQSTTTTTTTTNFNFFCLLIAIERTFDTIILSINIIIHTEWTFEWILLARWQFYFVIVYLFHHCLKSRSLWCLVSFEFFHLDELWLISNETEYIKIYELTSNLTYGYRYIYLLCNCCFLIFFLHI